MTEKDELVESEGSEQSEVDNAPPPFEPDEDLITYLEKGRDSDGEKR